MKQQNRNKGRWAEEMAVRALRKKGYEMVERNFANKFGEIDIIAKDGGTWVFVEVKAKTGKDFGLPEEMISPGKLTRVKKMATIYLEGLVVPCRIDVVAVVLTPEGEVARLTHYENVYLP